MLCIRVQSVFTCRTRLRRHAVRATEANHIRRPTTLCFAHLALQPRQAGHWCGARRAWR